MFFLDKLVAVAAPHTCMMCGDEGAVVCDWCLPDFTPPLPARCYRCKSITPDSSVCKKCRRTSHVKHVWVRATYEKEVKQLIHDFKFERKQAAAQPIARLLIESLPFLAAGTTITHVPTATSRVRSRGYDHAELLARVLARELGLKHETLLRRVTQTRQVGSKRSERLEQMQHAFRPVYKKDAQRTQILLVDDLVTTGATLEAAAKCLKTTGVRTVDAVVFAQK
jgi:ComF family protein